jgi:hypothetical protein
MVLVVVVVVVLAGEPMEKFIRGVFMDWLTTDAAAGEPWFTATLLIKSVVNDKSWSPWYGLLGVGARDADAWDAWESTFP